MSVTVALLLYVVVVLSAGPAVLSRLSADGAAPRLGVIAWLTAIISVIGSSIAAIALLIVEAAGHWGDPDDVLTSCLARLWAMMLGQAGWPAQTLALTAVSFAAGVVAWMTVRVTRTLGRMREQTFAHADAVRLVGRRTDGGVVVIDAEERAAYCVAGRPSAIVVTTAALAALDSAQLAAVLAHERAHLDGNHASIVAGVRSLAALFPHVALFTTGVTHVSTLLEMCADDVAVRRHGRQPLLAGLVALTGANPPHVMAAASVAVVRRARRLCDRREPLMRVRSYVALSGAVTVLAGLPLTVGVLAVSGILVCFA